MLKIIVLFSLLIFLSACVNPTKEIYYWGQYQAMLLNMYKNPGEETPGVQIEKLTTDIQKAENAGKPVPPGVYAHLGYMYAANGELDKSIEAFNIEKDHYPEASIFVEGIEKRAFNSYAEKAETPGDEN